ncbi:MAG TPA: polyphenol oxidase family protein [Gemmatimonadaceae bacterium]|nr:polyphenol oxidase family protein [Gemmatimonadaceae bacterium]
MTGAPALEARDPVAEFARIGVTAFTTTRAAGDFALAAPVPDAGCLARWTAMQAALAPAAPGVVSSVQVHGTGVAKHTRPWVGLRRLEGIDAHVVTVPGAAAVTVADCVPVFLAHPTGAVGIVHAGWRGTAARVLPEAMAHFAAAGLDPADLLVHLGPAICGRCYEVGPDVYEQLTGWQTIRHRHVDLRALLAEQAKAAGAVRLSASPWCTRCDNDRFFSHRAGDAGRQISVVVAGAGGGP